MPRRGWTASASSGTRGSRRSHGTSPGANPPEPSRAASVGQPALPVPGQAAGREAGVRLAWLGRLALDAGAVAQRRLVHRVGAPLRPCRAVARADAKEHARPVSGADDHVLRPAGAVDEVPGTQRPLLALDHEHRLAAQHEEVLLVSLPVVHRHRLAGAEDGEIDPELLEVERALEAGALELAEDTAALAFPPLRLACAQDEPALSLRDEAVLGAHELRLGRHRPTMPRALIVTGGRRRRSPALSLPC